jgi:hypothetical protein
MVAECDEEGLWLQRDDLVQRVPVERALARDGRRASETSDDTREG